MRILFFLVLLSLSLLSTTKGGIEIEYKVSYAENNPLVSADEMLPHKIILSVEGKNAKISEFYTHGATYERQNFYNSDDIIYIAKQLEQYVFWTPVIRYNQIELKKINKNYNTAYPILIENYHIIHLDYTAQVDYLGYPCKRAVGNLGNKKIEILYSDRLDQKFFPYGDLRRIALQYKVEEIIFGKIIYTATLVNEDVTFTRNFFDSTNINNDFYNIYSDNNYINTIAENIKVRNLNNEKIELDFKKNKITVLNFVRISHQEILKLNYLQQKYHDDNRVQIISISEEPAKYYRYFSKINELELKIYGNAHQAIRRYDANFLPTNVVIAPEGKIIFHRTHYWPTTAFYINFAIEKLLKKHFSTVDQQ